MRHRKSGKHLNRNSTHRLAMFKNMMVSLFCKECITTTLVKAKELRRFAEPMITLAKQDSVENRRLAFNRLRDKMAVGKLFADLGKRYTERHGGYLRILKCGFRPGDKAPMALVELIGQAEKKAAAAEAKAGKPAKKAVPKKQKSAKAKEAEVVAAPAEKA